MIWFKNKTNEIRMVNVNFGFYMKKNAIIVLKSFNFNHLQKIEHKLKKQACYFA